MHLLLTAAFLTSIAAVQPGEANRQPSLSSAPGMAALVFGSGNTIWFSKSADRGRTFSKPSQVAQVPALALGRHRGPRVVLSGDAILVSAVYGEHPATGPHAHGLPADGDLVAWRSVDGGRSWLKPVSINDVPGSAREGLHAMAAGDSGEIAAVWLDLRAAGTRLYGAYSKDRGETWSKNVLLYQAPGGTICQCCDPSLAISGHVARVMFRNVRDGARDMYLLKWNLGGEATEPDKLGAGSWKLDACPMDGGGVVQSTGRLYTAWRRDHTVYLDQPDQPETALGDGKDVAITLGRSGPYVAWSDAAGVQLLHPAQKQPQRLAPAGSFPTLTTLSEGPILAAWEQEGSIQLQTVE